MTDDDAYEAWRDAGVLVPHHTDPLDGELRRPWLVGSNRICQRCNLCVMRGDGTCYVCDGPSTTRDPDVAHPNDDPNAWSGT